MLGRGTGSEMRVPLGYTMVGGLVLSQALTLFTTPVIYLYLDEWSLRFKRRRRQKHPEAPAIEPPPRSSDRAVPPLEGAT
jgi:predicted RND superfamily exporter protein